MNGHRNNPGAVFGEECRALIRLVFEIAFDEVEFLSEGVRGAFARVVERTPNWRGPRWTRTTCLRVISTALCQLS